MHRKVEGLDNLNNILTLPIGSTFGIFTDTAIASFKVAGYLNRVAKSSEDPGKIATVIIPTYPLVGGSHLNTRRDLVYQDSVVTHPPVQNGTETFFISMIELNNAKL